MTSKLKKNDGTKVNLEVAQVKSVLMAQPDFLQPVVQAAVQAILEVGMEEFLQAGKHERSEQRLGLRWPASAFGWGPRCVERSVIRFFRSEVSRRMFFS